MRRPGLGQSLVGAGLALCTGAEAHAAPAASLPATPETERSQALADRGRAALAEGRLPEAVAAYRELAAHDPASTVALGGLAIAYDRLGRFDLSRTFYEAALALDPTDAVNLYNYGLSLSLQRDHAGARRFLALAAAAGDPDVEAAALRTLARDRLAHAEAPASAQVSAKAARAAQPGPRIVRTSGHEVRLVLTPEASADAPQLAHLGDEAVAAAPIERLDSAAERAIALADAQARRAEELAVAALVAAMAPPSDRTAEPALDPMLWRVAVPAQAAVARLALHRQAAPEGSSSARLARPAAAGATADRAGLPAASDKAVLPTRRAAADARMAAAIADPPGGPQRRFTAPFASDDARLNAFATRMHRPDATAPAADERLRRLEALVARMQQA